MSHFQSIRKAVFPVAGLGTRFLPATKSIPKEMLPVVDKPLIQYAVEEALEAGIETLIFITSRKKHAIADHFDVAFELETRLAEKGMTDLLEKIQGLIPEHVSRAHVPQMDTRGLGHAILCARELVGREPFAIVLADDLISTSGNGCLKQMAEVYNQTGDNVLAVQEIPANKTDRYGIVAADIEDHRYGRISAIVEKPAPEDAPSRLGVVGRYILGPRIFNLLENTAPGSGGEIQLTDAIAQLLAEQSVLAYEFTGRRYDCGSKIGFVKATLDYALEHADMRDEIIQYAGLAINSLNASTDQE